MSKKTKTNFISASVKRVRSLTLLVTGGVVMSSMALALLLQDTASSNNENVQVWGVQSRVQYLTGMTLSWANNNHIKFEYKGDTNSLNLNAAVNLHALILGASNSGAIGATVIGGHDNKVQGNWKNAAIIGGSNNTTNDTTSSIIAGSKGSSITKAGESAIFSAQGTIVGGENPTDTVFIVWGQNHITTNASTVFIAGAEGIKTTKSHNVLIGKNIRSNQSNIFVWSNGNTELTPQKGSAFYVNSTSGFGLNTNNPQAALDIANGGLAFNKVYQLSDLADVKEPWVILMVAKDGKQGICAYNGTTWVPLSLNAEREWLCVGNTQPARPIHVLRESVAISGAVANGSAVLTNGVTSLPQVWSGGMNNNHGGWLNHPWTYKHTGPLDNGDYRCGIGFHMGNPTPDGMKNTDCKACSPITNQRDWRSNGKNDDCDFSCKAGFKKVGRSCDTCEVWTYSVNGTTANSCASCTNKPANSHYTSNGTSATSCTWACDAGYHNVGWACKKAVWKPTVTPTCKAYPGKWKDGLKVTTYSCALQEDPSVAVPENICKHWSTKPANQTVAFADENCNPPEWETNRTCPQPACNLSRIAGKCGGNVSENVTCIKHKRDRAGYSYDTQNESQSKSCTRTCEVGACGYPSASKTQPASYSLCSLGSASTVGTAPVWAEIHWTWSCSRLDGLANCNVKKLPPDPGRCGSVHNVLASSLSSSSYGLCAYGAVAGFSENAVLYTNRWSWTCKGDAWAVDANCIAHKPAPQAGKCAQELNKCDVGNSKNQQQIDHGKRWECEWLHGWSTDTTCSLCDNGYVYNAGAKKCEPKCGAGYSLSNGTCVKWKCETIPGSTTPGQCSGTYQSPTGEYYYEGSETRWVCRRGNSILPEDCCEAGIEFNSMNCPSGPGVRSFYDSTASGGGRWIPCIISEDWENYTCRYSCAGEKDERYCSRKERVGSVSCSNLWDQSSCQSKSWCTRTPWITGPSTIKSICEQEGKWVVGDWVCGSLQKMSCSGEWKCENRTAEVWGVCKKATWWFFGGLYCSFKGWSKNSCESDSSCRWEPIIGNTNTAVCRGLWGDELPDSDCISPKPSCTTPVNGQCKTYAWTHESQPATSTANGCIAGDYLDDADTNTYWQWKCRGKNWGSEAICKASKKIAGKCWAEYMTCQVWTPTNWSIKRDWEPNHVYQGRFCTHGREKKRTCIWIEWWKEDTCRIYEADREPETGC